MDTSIDNKNIVFNTDRKGLRLTDRSMSYNLKANSSNNAVIYVDTGNAHIRGKVYDHHQFKNDEDKLKYPCAATLINEKAEEIYEKSKDKSNIKIVVHEEPDVDAIVSAFLVKESIEREGKLSDIHAQIVRIAEKSDTFTMGNKANFGAFLNTYILKTMKNEKLGEDIGSKIEKCIKVLENIVDEYMAEEVRISQNEKENGIMLLEERRKKLDMNGIFSNMLRKDSEFAKNNPRERLKWKKIQEYNEITKQKNEKDFYESLDNDLPVKEFGDMQKTGVLRETDEKLIVSDILPINLVNKRLSNTKRRKEFTKSEDETEVFICAGNIENIIGVVKAATEEYGVVMSVEPKGEEAWKYKISSSYADKDLGHFGRYIEYMKFREGLGISFTEEERKNMSGIEKKLCEHIDELVTREDFNENRERFIKGAMKPLIGGKDEYYTGMQTKMSANKDYINFTASSDSILSQADFVADAMAEYFAAEHPLEIDGKKFEKMLGRENLQQALREREELFRRNRLENRQKHTQVINKVENEKKIAQENEEKTTLENEEHAIDNTLEEDNENEL